MLCKRILSNLTTAVTVLILIENRCIFEGGIFRIKNENMLVKIVVLIVFTYEILNHVLSVIDQRFLKKIGILCEICSKLAMKILEVC